MAVSEFKGVSSELCNEMNDLESSLASIAASLAALSSSKNKPGWSRYQTKLPTATRKHRQDLIIRQRQRSRRKQK